MIAALYVETDGLRTRLFSRLVAKDDCLIWTGSINKKGYGQIAVATSLPKFTHRVAWELDNGPIPDGLCVLHRCDTPACCNTAHLFLGTRADNNADMRAKGRARCGVANAEKTHCKRGHPLEGENLRESNGRRFCRACCALWAREKRAKS